MSTNENKTITENKPRILSVPAILTRVLLRWKLILLCGILFAAAGMGSSYMKQTKKAVQDEETEQVTTELTSEEYYDRMIRSFDQAIINRYEYMAETLVDDMDPYSNAAGEAVLFVKGPESLSIISSDPAIAAGDANGNMLSASVTSFITYGMDWTSVKEAGGIKDDVLLNELVGAKNTLNTVTVTVQGPSREIVDQMLDEVIRQTSAKFSELKKNAGLDEYSLAVMEKNVTNRIYSPNFNWLVSRMTEIQNFTDAKNTFISGYNNSGLLNSGDGTVIKGSSLVKRGILWFLIGIMLSVCAVFMRLYVSAKVLSAAELNDTYGLRSLSVMEPNIKGRPASGIDALVLKILQENRSTLSEDARYELASSYVDELVEDGANVGIVSDLPEETVQKIAEQMNKTSEHVHYVALSGIRDKVEDRKKLSKADYAILAAGTEKSSYAAVNDLLTLTTNYKKPLVGTITL